MLVYAAYLVVLTLTNLLWRYSDLHDKMMLYFQNKSICRYYICKYTLVFLNLSMFIYLRYCIQHIIYPRKY